MSVANAGRSSGRDMALKSHWESRDYQPGDIVITIDGLICTFISFKMNDNYATLEARIPPFVREVYHRGNFRLWRRGDERVLL